MPANNRVAATGPNVPGQAVVDELTRLIRAQVPGLGVGTLLSAHLLKRIFKIIKENIAALMGTILTTAGLAALLPSLCVVVVNALGFTASGVLAGSVAAAVQSVIYGASTGGLFSMLQAFGATAVVASPVGLIIGGIALGAGAACLGWWWWRRRRTSNQGGGNSGNSPSDKGPSDS